MTLPRLHVSCPVHPQRTGGEIKSIGLYGAGTHEERYAKWAKSRGEICNCVAAPDVDEMLRDISATLTGSGLEIKEVLVRQPDGSYGKRPWVTPSVVSLTPNDFQHPDRVAERAKCAAEGHVTVNYMESVEGGVTHGTKDVCTRCGKFWHGEQLPGEMK